MKVELNEPAVNVPWVERAQGLRNARSYQVPLYPPGNERAQRAVLPSGRQLETSDWGHSKSFVNVFEPSCNFPMFVVFAAPSSSLSVISGKLFQGDLFMGTARERKS